ncbi:uncharacterized protein LOC134267259 [Saccostrea cucullata]|uniref:uncharacterized protein LOC134267259 n=1 Tax=Saccostrea cuccullata TaxID=36930 RepID=UPI002ED4CD98
MSCFKASEHDMFFTCRKGDTSLQDDTVTSINQKRTPSSSVSTERASFLSTVTLSRLLSKGPSQKSRALLFAVAILLVTITCLVFLLGVRIIRGEEDRGQLGKILHKMLDTLSHGHSNTSDTFVLRNTTTINAL